MFNVDEKTKRINVDPFLLGSEALKSYVLIKGVVKMLRKIQGISHYILGKSKTKLPSDDNLFDQQGS